MLDLPSSTNTGLSLIVPIVVKGYSPATGNVTREMLVVYAKPTSQANAGVMVSQLGPNKQAVLVDESGQVIQSYAGFADSYFPSFTPDALMVLERAQNFVAVDIVAARASGGSYSGFDALAVQLMAALCYPLGTEYYAYQCLYPVDLNNGVDLITGTALVTHQIKSFEIVSGTNF